MDFERPLTPRSDSATKRINCLSEFPPFDAGLTAALRRAYAGPVTGDVDCFDALLAKLR